MEHINQTMFITFRWLYAQGYEGKLGGKGSSNKVFFTSGVSLSEVQGGDKVFQNYAIFNEEGNYILTTTKQKVRVTIKPDNYSELSEKEQRLILDFISKVFNA